MKIQEHLSSGTPSDSLSEHGSPLRIHVARVGGYWACRFADELEAELDQTLDDVAIAGPREAEVILCASAGFVDPDDWSLSSLRGSWIFAEYSQKIVVYDERDRPWCWHPGVYVSMPRRGFDPRIQLAAPYLGIEDERFRLLREREPDLLYSFVGNNTHPCRTSILRLGQFDGALVEDISGKGFMFWDRESPAFDARRSRFDDVLARSKFVLCPRGHGTSSVRLYETLAAGRIPVIVSDEWVAPHGPAWDAFSVRVDQGAVKSIPSLLRSLEPRYDEMSAAAMGAFEEHFSRERRLTALVGGASLLVKGRPLPRPSFRSSAWKFELAARRVARQGVTTARRRVGRLRRLSVQDEGA